MKRKDICRLCLSRKSFFMNIFSSNDCFGHLVADIISELLQIEISKTDCLPEIVCVACFKKTVEFKEYKRCCLRSNQILNEELKLSGKPKNTQQIVEVVSQVNNDGISNEIGEDLSEEQEAEDDTYKMIDLLPSEYNENQCLNDITKHESFRMRGDAKFVLVRENGEIGKENEKVETLNQGSLRRWIRQKDVPLASRRIKGKRRVKYAVFRNPWEEEFEDRNEERNNLQLMNETDDERNEKKETIFNRQKRKTITKLINYSEIGLLCRDRWKNIRTYGKQMESIVEEGTNDLEDLTASLSTRVLFEPEVLDTKSLGSDGGRVGSKMEKNKHFNSERMSIKKNNERKGPLLNRGERTRPKLWQINEYYPYLCRMCGMSFGKAKALSLHDKMHKKGGRHICSICSMRFEVRDDLLEHKKVHLAEMRNICEVCGKRFATRSRLKEHGLTHSDSRPHMCDLCGKAFKAKAVLEHHLLVHRDERPFKCHLCNQGFRRKINLKLHIRRHSSIRRHKCPVCDKLFNSKFRMEKHLTGHSDKQPIACNLCNKMFQTSFDRKCHIEAVHSDSKHFHCDECGKDFSRRTNLKRHMATHAKKQSVIEVKAPPSPKGEVPVAAVPVAKNLYRMTHEIEGAIEEIPSLVMIHKCDFCGVVFDTRLELEKHALLYCIRRRHKCDACDKLFQTNSLLKCHMEAVHSGIKPYQCKVCEKAFSCNRYVMRHMAIHLKRAIDLSQSTPSEGKDEVAEALYHMEEVTEEETIIDIPSLICPDIEEGLAEIASVPHDVKEDDSFSNVLIFPE